MLRRPCACGVAQMAVAATSKGPGGDRGAAPSCSNSTITKECWGASVEAGRCDARVGVVTADGKEREWRNSKWEQIVIICGRAGMAQPGRWAQDQGMGCWPYNSAQQQVDRGAGTNVYWVLLAAGRRPNLERILKNWGENGYLAART